MVFDQAPLIIVPYSKWAAFAGIPVVGNRWKSRNVQLETREEWVNIFSDFQFIGIINQGSEFMVMLWDLCMPMVCKYKLSSEWFTVAVSSHTDGKTTKCVYMSSIYNYQEKKVGQGHRATDASSFMYLG